MTSDTAFRWLSTGNGMNHLFQCGKHLAATNPQIWLTILLWQQHIGSLPEDSIDTSKPYSSPVGGGTQYVNLYTIWAADAMSQHFLLIPIERLFVYSSAQYLNIVASSFWIPWVLSDKNDSLTPRKWHRSLRAVKERCSITGNIGRTSFSPEPRFP